jgi:hypothetical protein
MKSMPAASAAMVTISATVSALIGPPRSNGPWMTSRSFRKPATSSRSKVHVLSSSL